LSILAQKVATKVPSPFRGAGQGGGDRIKKHSRQLRNQATEAEKKLWYHIRNKQLGYKFRRQQPIGNYIADFVCLEQKLVVELDGGQHASQLEYDANRTEFLNNEEYRVFRAWNNEVFENIAGCWKRFCFY
jgi:very-short-patch-repair endonuclease